MAKSSRLVPIDATRGAAMLFVCLSHFGDFWFGHGGAWESPQRLRLVAVAMIASPTFMLISGSMLGLLSHSRDFARIRLKLLDRAFFLLTLGHVLIGLTRAPLLGGAGVALGRASITDAIGISICLGILLIGRLSTRARLALGAALVVATWLFAVLLQPQGLVALALVGRGARTVQFGFPILPWLGIYLIGTAVGEGIALSPLGPERFLRRAGSAAAASGASIAALYFALRPAQLGWESPSEAFAHVAAPFQKAPPSLAYALWYGGLGLLLCSALFAVERRGIAPRAFRELARVGRNSLFAFIAQFAVYYTAMPLLPRLRALPGPAVFAASLALLYAVVRVWDAYDLTQRLITVGFPWSRPAVAPERA